MERMGQSSVKGKGAAGESHSENCDNLPEDQISGKENTTTKRPQKKRLRFKIRMRLRESSSRRKKIDNENKEDGINFKEVEKDFRSETTESAGVDPIPERPFINHAETTLAIDSRKDLDIGKHENTQIRVKACEEPGGEVGNGHLDCDSDKQETSNLECTENTTECILILLKLANGVTSSSSPENVCEEEERIFLERRVFQLETPFKWLSDLKLSGEALSCSNEGCEGYEISKDSKARQDYFHITTYHLCQSAIFCKDHQDYQKALRELYQAKLAIKRFALQIEKQRKVSTIELEDEKRDQDITKYLKFVLTGSIAYIACQMRRYDEAKTLLQDIETEEKVLASKEIIKGIQGMTIANVKSALPVAISIIRETIALEPHFWRWHMVLSKLLQIIPEPDDPTDKIMYLDEISKELWKVHQLKKNDPVSAISLGDSYCNSLFLVRNLKNSLDNYEEYAVKAVDAYTTALSYAPHCALTHARVARSLWNLRKQHGEASKKALVAAEKAMAIILNLDVEEDAEDRDQQGKVGEAAMILGLFWESAGNVDKALALFRMAASNPYVQSQVSYRSELGIIIGCFQNDNKKRSHTKTDVLGLLDKLLEKFQDGNHKQQTLCHKGQYLMDVKKDNSAALDEFIKAIMINPFSLYLKKFYPRFITTFSRPVRISDLIHELACKELLPLVTKAKKGCPEAMERSKYLNECIALAQDSAGASQSNKQHRSKPEKAAVALEMSSENHNVCGNVCRKFTEDYDEKKPEVPGNYSHSVKSRGSPQRDVDVAGVTESLNCSKLSISTDIHQQPSQNTGKIKETNLLVNTGSILREESNQDESSDGKVVTAMSSIQEMIGNNERNNLAKDLANVDDAAKDMEYKVNACGEVKNDGDRYYKDTGVVVVKMIKKKTNEGSEEIGGGDTNDTPTNHLIMRETFV
ncbi:hypothetical protein J437_LFUL011960 [Ladona fulva]|uniref:Uncharacterized protein n=1 Tax=Ladona fulva TaxID=123851 RepID=A0A8K0KGR3_LADFU|nr:hypothetical protein J437_LFUL011960 [Ladona fulva]